MSTDEETGLYISNAMIQMLAEGGYSIIIGTHGLVTTYRPEVPDGE